MQFTIEERLIMLSLLPPAEGNLLNVKITHDLRQGLAFSEEDLAILQFEQSDGRLNWQNGIGLKELEIGPHIANVIYDELAKLNESEKLREGHLSLAEKFEYEG
jgi:hypothetical protein